MKKEIKIVDANLMKGELRKTGSRVKRVITKSKEGSDKITFSIFDVAPGVDLREVSDSDVIKYLLEGKCTIEWNGKNIELTPGMAIFIPAGTETRYQGESEHKIITIASPATL